MVTSKVLCINAVLALQGQDWGQKLCHSICTASLRRFFALAGTTDFFKREHSDFAIENILHAL